MTHDSIIPESGCHQRMLLKLQRFRGILQRVKNLSTGGAGIEDDRGEGSSVTYLYGIWVLKGSNKVG